MEPDIILNRNKGDSSCNNTQKPDMKCKPDDCEKSASTLTRYAYMCSKGKQWHKNETLCIMLPWNRQYCNITVHINVRYEKKEIKTEKMGRK